ncbi:MAG: hypothetical protein U0R44_04150 [Candidatus Micrarchaeia archaeon]
MALTALSKERGSFRRLNAFIGKSLLAGSILTACSPDNGLLIPDTGVVIDSGHGESDGGMADSGPPQTSCSVAEPNALSCQRPATGRVAQGSILGAGKFYLSLGRITFDPLGIPKPSIMVYDEKCNRLTGPTIPEGTTAQIVNPLRDINISLLVPMASQQGSQESWSEFQLQDGHCQRICSPVMEQSVVIEEGGSLQLDTPEGRRSFVLDRVDSYAHGSVRNSDGSVMWNIHLPPNDSLAADFWNSKLMVKTGAVDPQGRRAFITAQWQSCTGQ